MVTIDSGTVTVDITVRCGADIDFTVVLDDGEVSPTFIDLTGYEIRATLRKKYNKAALLELTNANGRVLYTDLPNGEFRCYVPGADTIRLNSNNELDDGVWDLELVNGTSITRLFEGTVTILPEATT